MPLLNQLKKLITCPAHPRNDYIISRYTYENIYSIAATFQQQFFLPDIKESICLCINDRGIMAGALLAALTRPVTLVIPYSFSETVLADMHRAHPFSKAIVQAPIPLPQGVEAVFPDQNDIGKYKLDGTFIRNPDEVFVKLFTGGSTSTPRTWSKTIRNLFSEAIHQAANLCASPSDRFAATVPAYHIYGLLFSVLTPFVASSSVIDDELVYPYEIQNVVSQNQASVLVSIPLHYKLMADMALQTQSLRIALSSAARLDAADSRAFYQKTGLGITEIFGSTETGGIASRLCTETQPHFTPFDCIDWKLADNRLAIRSRFISPELPTDPEGFFITNDQANPVGPAGFELTGRVDRIVKIAGNRVDLDEIRSALTNMPDVKDAVVICTPGDSGRGNEISALVATTATSQEIRHYLQHRIQACAIPRRIKIVDTIPISAAGKYKNTEIKKILKSL